MLEDGFPCPRAAPVPFVGIGKEAAEGGVKVLGVLESDAAAGGDQQPGLLLEGVHLFAKNHRHPRGRRLQDIVAADAGIERSAGVPADQRLGQAADLDPSEPAIFISLGTLYWRVGTLGNDLRVEFKAVGELLGE